MSSSNDLPSDLHGALQPYAQQPLLLALSGGADSVALFRALLQVGAQVTVGHIDHALRPESAQDAAWVQDLCEQWQVPVLVQRIEVARIASARGWNTEDAARRLRYQALSRMAKQRHLSCIVTAHTLRDQAETVLMQLLRGEAVLHGMPNQRGPYQRPWLFVRRAQIEQYLQALGQLWREDSSNADPHYTRAWLRAQVMPTLLARYPQLEEKLAQLAHWQRQDDEALHHFAAQILSHTPLTQQPVAVLRRYVKSTLASQQLDFRAEHLEQLAQALHDAQTCHATLPRQQQVSAQYGRLQVSAPLSAQADLPLMPLPFAVPEGWEYRYRRAGDHIQLSGGKRKLSDVLIDAQVPRIQRERVPVLAQGSTVYWLGLEPPVWAQGVREQLGLPPDPLEQGMAEALRLARLAATLGEVPIGAVVLHQGRVIGRGANTCHAARDMTQHAELQALREAAQTLGSAYLNDCTLVVTLEPCPMCLGAAIEARIGHIVYGASNPKAGALGGVADLLGQPWTHKPSIRGGFWAAECRKVLRTWFGQLRTAKASAPQ